jgi:hypothetical protein
MAISTGQYNLTPPTLADGAQSPLNLDSAGRLVVAAASSGSGATSDQVQGNVANGVTDAGNPVGVGGLGSGSTPTTVTTGQRVKAWFALNGAIVVSAASRGGSDGISNGVVGFMSSMDGVAGVPLATAPLTYNGTSHDRTRKANTFKRVASSAASGNPDFVKASPGDIMQFWGLCGATATFLQLYNKTTAPVIGTDTPALTYPLLATTVFDRAIPNGGAYFPTGIAFAFTTDAAGTTASAAAAVTSFAMLVA